MEYEVVMGLEVHAELATKTKIFCNCANEFGGEPNAHCCPVCMGMPGCLPVMNKKVLELAIRAGYATNCTINLDSRFDRKHYFYPDLPGAYQITQMAQPICTNGYVDFKVGDVDRRVRINRIHMEEDAGKLVHMGDAGTAVDCNRGGVPLVEIVTEPDLRGPDEAIAFLEALKENIKFAGVSDCKMEQGSLRCDVNISLRPVGETKFGTRVEMKNINSFKAAHRASLYEIDRQKKMLNNGEVFYQETRRWDDNKGVSYSMRSKETALDYKYFPNSDLVPIILEQSFIDEVISRVPMLPVQRRAKYIGDYGLSTYDAKILTSDPVIAKFFDDTLVIFNNSKVVANWIMGTIMRKLKDNKDDIVIPISPSDFAVLLSKCENAEISNNAGIKVLDAMWNKEGSVEEIIKAKGLAQISDTTAIRELVVKALLANPKPVEDYKKGNTKAIGFVVGMIMKESKGKANPQMVNQMVAEEIAKI